MVHALSSDRRHNELIEKFYYYYYRLQGRLLLHHGDILGRGIIMKMKQDKKPSKLHLDQEESCSKLVSTSPGYRTTDA
jgi:hypothetical protein